MKSTLRSDLGYLFDVDGVLTPTATVHEQAWKQLFDAVLDAPFTEADYRRYVDGKSRRSGVESTLASRGMSLTSTEVDTLAQTKNDLFLSIVQRDGVKPYPDAASLTAALVEIGAPMAVVSSSRNARTVLESAGLADRFIGWVDGQTALEEGLAGKPDPAMFERAAEQLGLRSQVCVVIEDAEAGVAAGAAGDFALVIGVDRSGNAQGLFDAGADVVISDLNDVAIVTQELSTPTDQSGGHAH